MQLPEDDSAPSSDSHDELEEPFLGQPIEREANPLIGSLCGVLGRTIDALVVTNDYKTSPTRAVRPFHEEEHLEEASDRRGICKLFDVSGFCHDKIKILSNMMATRKNIINAGYHLSNYSVVFVQGHAQYRIPVPDPIRDNPGIEYLTYDFHMSNPPQGLTCNAISNMLIPLGNGGPTQRLLLSDFCFGYNLNDLQYVLGATPGTSPKWDWIESPDWNPSLARDDDDLLVHFAAGSLGQSVHESRSSGGFFTQGFCKAMMIPRTLPDLLKTVRNNVGKSLSSNGYDPKLQVPQIYSSRRLDLNDPSIMKMFGFFNKVGAPTPKSVENAQSDPPL